MEMEGVSIAGWQEMLITLLLSKNNNNKIVNTKLHEVQK